MSAETDAITAALASEALTTLTTQDEIERVNAVIQQESQAQPVVAQPPVVASDPVVAPPAPAAVAPESVPDVDFKPKLSDELQALLDEPDFDEEAAAEVAAEMESDEYDGEYVDPAVAAKLKALERRNAFLEQRVVEAGRKKWIQENLEAYPLLKNHFADEVKGIQASSRRGFAREAARLNEKYEKALGPVLTVLEETKKKFASGAVETARAEVAAAWGTPASDTLPPLAAAQQDALDKARKAGDLTGSLKVLMNSNPVL